MSGATHYETEKRLLLRQFGHVFDGSFIAGGAVLSTFTNSKINDFDIYFKSESAFRSALEKAYSNSFWCVSLTSRAITFKKDEQLYQFMHFRWFPTATEIFDTFDFTCCMGAIDLDVSTFELHPRFLVDASRRELAFNHNTAFPIASAMRVQKYLGRGFQIPQREWLKVIAAVSFKKISTWAELKEQIGGTYGNVVAMATDKPFTLDNVIDSLSGAHFESKSETDPPSCDDEVDAAIALIKESKGKPEMPGSAKDALAMVEKLKDAACVLMRLAILILALSMPAQAARPNEACVGTLSAAIAVQEGYWIPGTIAWRQHNPGCLRGRDGRYLRYATSVEGWQQLRAEIRRKLRTVGLKTMLERWSETEGYGEKIREIAGKNWSFCE